MKNLSPGVVGRLMPVVILSMFCLLSQSRHDRPKGVKGVGTEIYPTGSSSPDCSHASGPCFPCKRVMVNFKCSVAESCPIVYRCMCKGKYYPVPSN